MIKVELNKSLKNPSNVFNLEVEFELNSGDLLNLTGLSGSGKTSILKMIAGLMTPDQGTISVNGSFWFSEANGINLKARRRKTGYVFQEYSLFPNMTVLENLKFAASSKEDRLINDLLEITELGELMHQKPIELSGGQQQRVALARAIACRPKLLLLDEPFSALDRQTRQKMQDYVLKLHREFELTTILVSHDVSEILKMATHVIELENGLIRQEGHPSEIFVQSSVSGKFQFTGEVFEIVREDVVYIVSVLIGNGVVKVVADEHEAHSLSIGDKVLVASKAFNPIIKKIN